MTAEILRAVREKAELLNGGASLGKAGDALAEMAVGRALAFCQRTDVPEDMEQAVGALLLALWRGLPRSAGDGDGTAGDGNGSAGDGNGTTGDGDGSAGGGPARDWTALLASGAVKTVQRGDTSITFQSGGAAAASAALSGTETGTGLAAALEDLKPWRRLGRLKREEGPGNGA